MEKYNPVAVEANNKHFDLEVSQVMGFVSTSVSVTSLTNLKNPSHRNLLYAVVSGLHTTNFCLSKVIRKAFPFFQEKNINLFGNICCCFSVQVLLGWIIVQSKPWHKKPYTLFTHLLLPLLFLVCVCTMYSFCSMSVYVYNDI